MRFQILFLLLFPVLAQAGDYKIREHSQFSSDEYFLRSFEDHRNDVFDQYRPIDLDLNIEWGSDCGSLNFESSLQATLGKVLDFKYYGREFLKTVMKAGPMLTLCYISPAACSVLKRGRATASMLTQLKMSQCAMIEKYTDSRADEYYKSRQKCVQQTMARNGRNIEEAVSDCSAQNVFSRSFSDWSGDGNGETRKNSLIGSSAKWAGFTQGAAKEAVDLLTALVGDSVVTKGNVYVQFGPKKIPTSTTSYLSSLEKTSYGSLCGTVLRKVERRSVNQTVDSVVSENDLVSVNGKTGKVFIDRKTLRSLAALPYRQRRSACKTLAEAIALNKFATDMDLAISTAAHLAQNPHLPPERVKELNEKRKALKDSIDVTLELKSKKTDPINKIVSEINSLGRKYQMIASDREIETEDTEIELRRATHSLLDCADRVSCE